MNGRREIVDNETGGYTMADFLNEAIARSKSNIDIASGYFNVSGFTLLKDRLLHILKEDPNFRMRLLFGREVVSRENRSSMDGDVNLHEELTTKPIENKYARMVDDLVGFLKSDNVSVKKNPERFNHAKCYIFDDVVVVGSTNFTGAGLTRNMELNAALYQPSAQELVKEWFERRWQEAQDTKTELIELLEESKFGLPIDPYLLYMKLLFEYYGPRLKELEGEIGHAVELTKFQEDAVKAAIRIIRKYNGVIIADSTGLGKTHIGIELLRHFVAINRKKAIVIAPAQVLNQVWKPKLEEESIKAKEITLESTGTSSFIPEDLIDYDVVLIDESHNYRNQSTNRRKNLMKLLSGGRRKQVILMSATPVNNSLMDLYHQLSLISSGEDSHFVDLGIPDLRRHFITADRKELAVGIESITRLLDEVMIRRTRQFIIENYANAELNGKIIRFPKRLPPVKVEYSLTELFGDALYKQLLDVIDALHLVPYRVDYYLKTVGDEERREAEQRATLQKIGLLKRFESSVEAVRRSIGRLIKFYEYFEKSVNEGKILTSTIFNKIVKEIEESVVGDEINDETIFNALENAPLERLTGEYDIREMKIHIQEDLNKLRPLKKNLDNIKPYADRKLRALEEQFLVDKTFEKDGKKAIVFTQFVDTARYLFEQLKKEMPDREARLITGETDEKARSRILREFAPKSNPGGMVEREADLLISTEVLSEGQNLQDANYIVNYDLPWNPMKIVQRVGRVDRLGSEYDTVTSVVFIPEKDLEDVLGLLEKLQEKIKKASETVGTEATILGEKENPKTFNAISRIREGDPNLMDDLENASELLPPETPFLSILSYLKQQGDKKLRAIPLGKRSGKKSTQLNGLVLFYREKADREGIHLLYYDYNDNKFERYNDVAWIFRKVESNEDEKLELPVKGEEAFRQFELIDKGARQEILKVINSPLDAMSAQKVKGKSQRELKDIILGAFTDGKVSKKESLPIYELMNHKNLMAWEEELQDFLNQYKKDQDVNSLLVALGQLFERFKIRADEREQRKNLDPSDLEIVCYMFLWNNELTFRITEN